MLGRPVNAASLQRRARTRSETHAYRSPSTTPHALATVRAVVHPLRRPRQPRNRSRRDQGRTWAVQHRARDRVLRVRVFVCDLPDLRRMDRRPLRLAHHTDRLRADLGRIDVHDRARAQPRAAVRRALAAGARQRRDVHRMVARKLGRAVGADRPRHPYVATPDAPVHARRRRRRNAARRADDGQPVVSRSRARPRDRAMASAKPCCAT
ncbi:major facilitator superfamily MFS_1 [Burkholderia cenocepacia]|nr:major facilitator superfamily MFS_1 [Burkholderia cenocepacia]